MKTALILIDIQYDYFEQGVMKLSGSQEAAKNARLVLDHFRLQHEPVVHVRHIANRPDATFFLPGTSGSEIHALVKPTEEESVILKHFPNSFRDTNLLDHLKAMQTNELVVCGMMTHMCVDATVRAARDLGFQISLIGDACATKDLKIGDSAVKSQDVQYSFLAALNGFYATVITTHTYLYGKQ